MMATMMTMSRTVFCRYAAGNNSVHHVVTCIAIMCTCFAGVGGQMDFIRGAAIGIDGLGKPIIAMPSVTDRGESKIVSVLKPGTFSVKKRHVFVILPRCLFICALLL